MAQIKEILVVALGIIFVKMTKQEDGLSLVPVVGPIPRGLPPFELPWQQEAARKLLDEPGVLQHFLVSGVIWAQLVWKDSVCYSFQRAVKTDVNRPSTQVW